MSRIAEGAKRFAIVSMWIAIIMVVSACASVPPPKSVTNVDQIAGKWQGSGYGPGGAVAITQTINPDGSYSAVVGSRTLTGKITLTDGKLRGKGDQTGNTGTYSLHEGDGRRVLLYKSDDGRFSGELTPPK